MNRYTIHCTPEQTKRALELGAPINTVKSRRTKDTVLSNDVIEYDDNFFTYVVSPTAEQIIGWLEEQEDIKEVAIYRYYLCGELYWTCDVYKEDGDYAVNCISNYASRKEATLAAIDAALEYLENLKN